MESHAKQQPDGKICYSMGRDTLGVPLQLFKLNQSRLCERLRDRHGLGVGTVVLLKGGERFMRYCTDVEIARFRQESNFHWLFGVGVPGCTAALNIHEERVVLFVPRPSPVELEPSRSCYNLQNQAANFELDEVYYTDELENTLRKMTVKKILTLKPVPLTRGFPAQEASFPGMQNFDVCNSILTDAIAECRVIKTDLEVDVLRYVNHVTSKAQLELMKHIQPGWHEHQAESFFTQYCHFNGGVIDNGWENIVRSGPNNAFQKYTCTTYHASRQMKDGDMCILDFSLEYCCYAGDITFAYPVNGKFTKEQRDIYNVVLNTYRAVLAATKPGVTVLDLQLLAERTLLTELRALGILQGDVDAMLAARLALVFMSHGVSHLVGVDVVDVGGITEEYPIDRIVNHLPVYRSLVKNMVLTVEPGCYFNNYLINKALCCPSQSQFIAPDILEQYRAVAGVRVEDTVVITADGADILSLAGLPRTVDEIETFMARHEVS